MCQGHYLGSQWPDQLPTFELVYRKLAPAAPLSPVGVLIWLRVLQCGVMGGNAGAIREEIGAFISLSSVRFQLTFKLSGSP